MIHGHGVGGVAQRHSRGLLVLNGQSVSALAPDHEGRSTPDDAIGSDRGLRRVLIEGQNRSGREGAVEHGLRADGDGHLRVPSGALLVDGPRSSPPRVGIRLGTAGQLVVDADLEGGAVRHLAGLGSGEELGDVEPAESRLHLDVNREGCSVVQRVGRLQTASQGGGVVPVPHTCLNFAIGGVRGRLVVDDVVATRREGAGHLDGGDIAVNGDVEVEVALAGVLVGSGSVRDLYGVGRLPLNGAGDQPPPVLVGDVGLPGTELVGEGDGRPGLAIHGQRLTVLFESLLDLGGTEDQLPGQLLGVSGEVVGPLGDRLRLIGAVDVLGDLAAGNGHRGFRAVGIDCQLGRVGCLSGHHQRRAGTPQSTETLGGNGVEGVIEGAGDLVLGYYALTHLVVRALVGDRHWFREVLPAADLLGQSDLEGVPALGANTAGIPGELQLKDVTTLDRGLVRILLAVGIRGHKFQVGDGDLRVDGGSGLRRQDRQHRGDEHHEQEKSTCRTRRRAEHSGSRGIRHGKPFGRRLTLN